MCKYLKFTFILPLFFIGCAEDGEESLPYIDVIWISYEKTASCYLPGVEDNWPDDYINIYGLNSAVDYPRHPDGCHTFRACKYVHYYKDLGYIEYEPNSGTSMESKDLTESNYIEYKAK